MKIVLKRFLLILLGILLSLVVLELSLRLAGLAVSSYQQYKNNRALKNKSQYTIICLGESTTAGQYPKKLQQILDIKYPNKFSVIDCGIPGAELETILELSDKNIKQYNPTFSICMMGINNDFVNFDNDIKNVDNISKYTTKKSLKIIKLFSLLKKHVINFYKDKFYNFNNLQDNDLSEHLKTLKNNGEFEKEASILKNLIKQNSDNEKIYKSLMISYFNLRDYDKCYDMAVNAFKYDWEKSDFYHIIFQFRKNPKEFEYFINKAVTEDIDIFKSEKKYLLYTFIKDFISEEKKQELFNIIADQTDKQYSMLGIDYLNKDYNKAQEYFDKAEELRLNFPNKETYDLYKQIVRKFIDNNIKVICMQYPVRSIKSLQKQLQNEPYFDKITFISNEENFKQALTSKNYNELFVDQFAGDFGHCTDLGNTMIAENVVKSLEKLIN